jgi:uncharacterized coiled-coil protein SlyX
MRKYLIAGLTGLALLMPATAGATGNHEQSPPQQKDCACCGDLNVRIDQLSLVFDRRVTALENRVSVLEQQVQEQHNLLVNLNNWISEVNQRVTQVVNRVDALSCTSSRIYTYRLRKDVGGDPVSEVLSVTVAGTHERGSVSRRNGRFVVRADYRGIAAPSLQFRTAMTHVRLASGREVDLVQYVRLCGARDGGPNKTPAQAFAGR